MPPFFENFNQRIVKSPKIYFYDTGLLCHLLNLNEEAQIGQYYGRGSLFENLVVSEMLKNRWHSFRPAPFYFWKDSHGTEVDLVVTEGGQTSLVEVKYSFTPKPEFFKVEIVFS